MRRNHAQHNRPSGLRYLEQYAQAIVTAQPFPSRRFNWIVLLRLVAPTTVFGFLVTCIVFLIEEYVNRNQSILDRPSRFYITIIFLLIGLSIVLYTDVLKPMYYWWYGLQSGRYTIARITTIAPRKLRWGDTFEGHWQFVIDTTIYATPFLVSNFQSGSWVMRLAVGSAVHVLLHPTKPTVLVAIGIVNEASPMLIPPTESALLAELLARRSSDDSTSVVD